MPAAIIPIGSRKRACWSLLEVARPGRGPCRSAFCWWMTNGPAGVSPAGFGMAGRSRRRMKCEVLAELHDDLGRKALETGGARLLDTLEDSLSHFLRIGNRTAMAYAGDAQAAADRLFDEHVDAADPAFCDASAALRAARRGYEIRRTAWRASTSALGANAAAAAPDGRDVRRARGGAIHGTSHPGRQPLHFPRAGDGFAPGPVAADRRLRAERRPVAIYGQALCGTCQPRRIGEREAPIRLEPRNPEFEAFKLDGDRFRVIAEFVQVLPS